MIELNLAMAERAMRPAQERAKDLGTPMTVTVVDEAGRLVISARGDGTGFFTPDTSRGIGCGGGTGEQDHECALAGAQALAG